MVYLKALAGGFLTLLFAYIAFIAVLSKRFHGEFGVSASVFLEPVVLLTVFAVFALGVAVTWTLLRR